MEQIKCFSSFKSWKNDNPEKSLKANICLKAAVDTFR